MSLGSWCNFLSRIININKWPKAKQNRHTPSERVNGRAGEKRVSNKEKGLNNLVKWNAMWKNFPCHSFFHNLLIKCELRTRELSDWEMLKLSRSEDLQSKAIKIMVCIQFRRNYYHLYVCAIQTLFPFSIHFEMARKSVENFLWIADDFGANTCETQLVQWVVSVNLCS